MFYEVANENFIIVGLPGNIDMKEEYRHVCTLTEGLDPSPITRLSALLENDEQVCIYCTNFISIFFFISTT